MTTIYREVIKAALVIKALDATYAVQFDEELVNGRTWEFDPMSDAVGQNMTKCTGNMRVRINPVLDTMAFPQDASRPTSYVLNIEKAREFWKFLTSRNPQFWFALDTADQAERGV